jgi:hypothetical protein
MNNVENKSTHQSAWNEDIYIPQAPFFFLDSFCTTNFCHDDAKLKRVSKQ